MSSINNYFTKTRKAAERESYKPLTDPYLPGEYHLMERVIKDMRRGDIDYCLVNETDDKGAICVYRKTSSFDGSQD